MLKIISAPSAILSQQAKPIGKIDNEVLSLIERMKKTLQNTRDPEGVGLAAPQVGKSVQIFILKPSKKSKIHVFINPTIQVLNLPKPDTELQKKPKRKKVKLEGCLSLPNIWGHVERNPQVSVLYLNEEGKKYKKVFAGFDATIIQHEYDHLQGVLFPKRVLEQKQKLFRSSKNQKGEDEFEEIEL